MQDYSTPRPTPFQPKKLKRKISQTGLAAMLMLILLSIGSVTGRSLSADDWQRSAGTSSNNLPQHDTLLPCVESAACVGRVFGSQSEDVSLFGNVPPCISYGQVRCIQHAGPAIADPIEDRPALPTIKHYYPQPTAKPIVQPYGPYPQSSSANSPRRDYVHYPSKVPVQEDDRLNEPARYATANNQRIVEWQSLARQQDQSGRYWDRYSVGDGSLEIPADKRAKFNMGVFQFQTSISPAVNKQPVEYVGSNQQPSEQSESPGLSWPTERALEFHHGQQRFEQSSEQLRKPSKFVQQKNKDQLPRMHQPGQNQLTQTVGYEFLDNNLVQPQKSSQHNTPQQRLQFQQSADEQDGQERMKTRTFDHRPENGQQEIVDVIQRFVKVNPKPVEVMPVSLQTAQLREESNRLFQVPRRVQSIQQDVRLVRPGERVMDSPQFVEPPVQRKLNELQQGFAQVNQQFTEPVGLQQTQSQQFASQSNIRPQAIERPVEFHSPSKPIVQQPTSIENKQESPSLRPLHHVKESVVWVTAPPRLPQTTVRPSPVEPRKLEQPTAVMEPSSLIKSFEFIEPAKSSLESLLIRFNSAKDTQQADEQLTALLRFLAMPANQRASPEEMVTGTSDSAPPFTGKHESNVIPFIAFSDEPLPLEPPSNSLF